MIKDTKLLKIEKIVKLKYPDLNIKHLDDEVLYIELDHQLAHAILSNDDRTIKGIIDTIDKRRQVVCKASNEKELMNPIQAHKLKN